MGFGDLFLQQFKHFPEQDQAAIKAFIAHLKTQGFNELQGRNKPSWDVDPKDDDFMNKVTFARENNLHHYHIGVPTYEPSGNGLTSRYFVHYSLLETEEGWMVKIVDYGEHPFTLPKPQYLA